MARSRACEARGYGRLVRERLGDGFVPSERIFATDAVFAEPGAAWLVAYEDGLPVACGGLRTLKPGVGEIKRMFVTAGARGRGHARRLLRELERRAAAAGHGSVRLLTTDVLSEARALYASEGYVLRRRREQPGEPVTIWLEKALPASRDHS
ncbi:MAG TPA: GNAT family N-acetyltransferase [Solirubrobacteraceae bacterium]|nr:GNAT family N-acetyltransferase [Solirubrobacteraceae bacterium]